VPRGIIQRDAVRIFKWADTTLYLYSSKKSGTYMYNKKDGEGSGSKKRGGGKMLGRKERLSLG
jgi:hypothetical protein